MPYYGGTPMAADPQFLMQRLMAQGMSRMQAAAIVGNLQQESGLASNSINKKEGAYGLMQWRGDRFTGLQDFAAKQNKPWTDPGVQADYIAHEMRTTEAGNTTAFSQARTVDEAAAAMKPVIRYGDKSLPNRQMFARDLFGAGDPSAPETSAAPVASAPQPTTTAQPAAPGSVYGTGVNDPYWDQLGGVSSKKPLRSGLASFGEGLYRQATGTAKMPPGLADIGQRLRGLGQSFTALADPQQAPPVNPPGGEVPLPRARPDTAPGGAFPDSRLARPETVAGLMGGQPGGLMGGVVDPLDPYRDDDRYGYG
jgi:Phage tail lysozyme